MFVSASIPISEIRKNICNFSEFQQEFLCSARIETIIFTRKMISWKSIVFDIMNRNATRFERKRESGGVNPHKNIYTTTPHISTCAYSKDN